MYQSRKHYDYDNCHISIDTKTGEILEIYTTRNYDNIIKSHIREIHGPFVIKVEDKGDIKEYFPMHTHKCGNKTETYVQFKEEISEKGMLITVQYSYITDGEILVKTDLSYMVLLKGDKIKFNLNLTNDLGSARLKEVKFPIISGVFLGEDFNDDTLIFPDWAGMKIKNPIGFFTKQVDHIPWRWQDYLYGYSLDSKGNGGRLASQGLAGFSTRYPAAGACMSWLDLYDKDGGIYFACHDKDCTPLILDVGNLMPLKELEHTVRRVGLVFSTAFEPYTAYGEKYSTPDVVLAFHAGNWHDGAKIYREFRSPYIKPLDKYLPVWAKDSPGLFAHYDFKYQHGGIVHKYNEIPHLAQKALDAGAKHLLFSGWNKGGFDNGYPEYVTDDDLGTEQEFIDGVKKAKEMGVHITLYMNRSLHNAAIDPDHVQDKAVMRADGSYIHAKWGNTESTDFYSMCPACKEWQDQLCGYVKLATDKYGVDGIYLDILSAGQQLCFNPKHNHKPDSFNEGVQEIIKRINKEYLSNHGDGILLMGEHINDNIGEMVSFQLNQSFFNITSGAFPNMYRYTFPTHGVVDMIYPTKNMAFRADIVSKKAELLMATLLTNGSYFWAYDLELDCTFDRDEKGMGLLKQLFALKKIMLKEMHGYLFCDTDDIIVENDNSMVKIFKNTKGEAALVGYRLKDGENSVKFDFTVKKVNFIFADGSEKTIKAKKNTVALPKDKMFIAFIK